MLVGWGVMPLSEPEGRPVQPLILLKQHLPQSSSLLLTSFLAERGAQRADNYGDKNTRMRL